jgi:hypothetical protein
VYDRTPATLPALPLMPEWYLLLLFLAGVSVYELTLGPILFRAPSGILLAPLLFAACATTLVVQASIGGYRAVRAHRSRVGRFGRCALTALMHLLQPLARLSGRLQFGLTPRRSISGHRLAFPWPRTVAVWSENWQSASERLVRLEADLRLVGGAAVSHGSEFDRWDIEVRTGSLGAARLRLAVEEHGEGKQFVRFRIWPRPSRGALLVVGVLLLALFLGHEGAAGDVIVGAFAVVAGGWIVRDCAAALAVLWQRLAREHDADEVEDDLPEELASRARRAAGHASIDGLTTVRSYIVRASEGEE